MTDEWWRLHFCYFFSPFRTSKLLTIILKIFDKHSYFNNSGVVSFCWGAWNDGEISLIGKFSFFFMFSSEFNEWQVLLSLWFKHSEKWQRSNDGKYFYSLSIRQLKMSSQPGSKFKKCNFRINYSNYPKYFREEFDKDFLKINNINKKVLIDTGPKKKFAAGLCVLFVDISLRASFFSAPLSTPLLIFRQKF